MISLPLSFKYDIKNQPNGIDIYDSGVALSGIARVLSLSAHYLVNGKIIKKAPSLEGVKIKLLPPRKGSFIFDVDISIVANTLFGDARAGIVGALAYDYMKMFYHELCGRSYKIVDQNLSNEMKKRGGDVAALIDNTENDGAFILRPIINNYGNLTVFSGSNNIIKMDSTDHDYMTSRIVSDKNDDFSGTVSSFNANSGKGRIYLSSEGRNVSFDPDGDFFNQTQKQMIAWSLNEYVNHRPGILNLGGFPIVSKNGKLKSIKIYKISR